MKYRKALNNFSLFFMILALCTPGFSKDEKVEGTWASAPVKIDGSNSDWIGNPLTFDKKVKVDYAFRNDAENLYVLFIFKDTKYLSSINQTGMTLWLNTEGKKKKDYGVKFQSKTVSADGYISLLEKMMGPMPEEKKKEIKSKPRYTLYLCEAIGKKSENFIATGPGAPAFKSVYEKRQNLMIYEFRIPLIRREGGKPFGIGTEPGKVLKIGFEWGGMTKEMRSAMMKRRAASSKVSDRKAGISGDVTRERDGVTGSTTMPVRRPKKHSFWVEVKLAKNQ